MCGFSQEKVDPFLRGVCKSMHRYFCFMEDRNTWIRYLSNFIQIFKKKTKGFYDVLLIRFVTECLRKCVELFKSVEGGAECSMN